MNNRYANIFLAMLLCLMVSPAWSQPSGRVTSNLVALYPFTEGSGSTVHDVSGYGTALDLTIYQPTRTSWISGGGISFNNSTVIESAPGGATKIIDACQSTNEITIEAWVKPANTSQSGPARIVSLSANTSYRNFTMGQQGNDYSFRLRTGTNNNNGTNNELQGGQVSPSGVQHVVMTRDFNGVQRIYVNGVQVATNTNTGNFSNWYRSHSFMLGNEYTLDRSWLGEMYMVAVYKTELNHSQVNQNYQAGYNSSGATGGGTSTASCDWEENFNLSDWSTNDNGPTAWTSSYSGSGYFTVYGGKFKGNNLDQEAVWTSEVVDISSSSNAYISLKANSEGYMESVDYIKFYYKLDGSNEVLFAERYDNFNNNNQEQITVNNLNGNTVQLIVKMYNTASDEYFKIDDIEINCGTNTGSLIPPSTPSCSSGNLLWTANVSVNGSTVNASPRLKESNNTYYTMFNGNLPSAFNGPVEVSIDEAVSWDGYTNRTNVSQDYEQWRVVFLKNGNIEWASNYTGDLADNVKSAEWKGSLGTAVLPNGADQVIIAHIGDNTYGNGSTNSSANSVVPSSVCIDYDALPCNNLTSGGQIAGDQSECGTYDPAPITSVMLPNGGSGTIEYVWMTANEPIYPDASNASPIPNSNSATYDPGPITQTTYYRRCARRVGCTVYAGESNDIVKEVTTPPSALVAVTDPSCTGSDGEISFSFADNSSRSTIKFSMDGGNTYPLSVADNSGSASFTNVSAGTYDLYVIWGDDDCPTSLGQYTLTPGTNTSNLTVAISSSSNSQAIRQTYEVVDLENSISCSPNHPDRIIWMDNLLNNILSGGGSDKKYWTVSQGGSLVEYSDGTAVMTAEISNAYDSSYKFDVYVELSDYSTTAPSQSPKGATCNSMGFDSDNFTYYQTFTGTLTGKGPLAGGLISIDRAGPSWQTGYGANVFSGTFGASAWYNVHIMSHPSSGGNFHSSSGDFNLDLRPISEAGSACGSADLTAKVLSGQGNGITYSWTGPNGFAATTPTVTVTESGTYTVTVSKGGCSVSESVDISIENKTPPTTTVSSMPPNCGMTNGEITFTFPDENGRSHIEFSIDGGATFPLRVQDNIGSTSFTGLAADKYDVWVRWGNDECPVSLGLVDLTDCLDKDYGDAPQCYGVAAHQYRAGTFIGTAWDAEIGSSFSNDAKGDDDALTDDEDGVTFIGGANGSLGETRQVTVVVTQTVDNDDYLKAWIDFDGNCQFDSDEVIIDNFEIFQDPNPQSFTFTYTVPEDAKIGQTYARFRLSTDQMTEPTGSEQNGEVEDYEYTVACNLNLSLDPATINCGETSTKLIANVSGAKAATNGLNYAYYEESNMSQLPDFSALTPVKTGTVANFDLSDRDRNDDFAFMFTGYIDIASAGQYTFYTSSDDGSKLYIDGAMVVDNDGLHSNREESGSLTLTEGYHEIKVTFFERGGQEVLQVKYEGPGAVKQLIPNNRLFKNLESSLAYAWTGPNGFSSSDEEPTVSEFGTYVLSVTDSATECTVSDSVTVTTGSSPVTDAGEIGPDQYICGHPFLPDTMGSIRDADGTAEYRWLVSEDPNAPLETWWVKAGADKPYMAFGGPIKKSCWFIRQAKSCDSASWKNSNIAAVIVRHQPRPSFKINFDGTTCASPAAPLTVKFDARKWGSRSNVYTWYFPGADDTDGELQGPQDPQDQRAVNVQTTYSSPGTYQAYLTVAWADRPGVPTCDSTIILTFKIDDCANCDNVTDPGTITGNQAGCEQPFTTSPIGGPPATGGSGGAIEYFWIYTNDPYLPPPLWSAVPGGVGTDKESINPSDLLGPLNTTTYFIRCVRRTTCDAHLESNVVVVEVDPTVRQKCTSFEIDSLGYSLQLTGLAFGSNTDTYVWTGNEGKLTTYEDGSAKLEGLLENKGNANLKFYASFELKPAMDWMQWQNDTAAKAGQYESNILGDEFTHTTWDYYRIDLDKSLLVGFGYFGNDTLYPTSSGLTQVGIGANTENMNYGIYSRFDFASTSSRYSGTATFKNDFDECVDVCPGLPRVSARVFLNGAYNLAAGEMTPELGPNRFLSRTQPFDVFGYNGTEAINPDDYALNPVMNDIVTWVLIELRTKDEVLELQGRQAGLLLRNGNVIGTDLKSLVELPVNPDTEYYIGVRALGYFGVLTDVPRQKMGRVLTVDFTDQKNAYTLYDQGVDPSMVQILPGMYGLIEGDALGEGNIDGPDIQDILNHFGEIGQFHTDLDVNGVTDGLDIQRALLNLFRKTNMLEHTSVAPTVEKYMYNQYIDEDFDENDDD